MKISTRRDIDAPIEEVFAAVTDFDRFERQALRRGAEVVREDPGDPGGAGGAGEEGANGIGGETGGETGGAGGGAIRVGSRWRIRARIRGQEREIETRLTRLDPPVGATLEAATAGLRGEVTAELVALSARRTRIILGIDLRPETLKGRLLVQSLKLARRTLTARLDQRLERFARELERPAHGAPARP